MTAPDPATSQILNPDGTTNYGASVPNVTGTATIWNLPSDLNNKEIWFDTGYTHSSATGAPQVKNREVAVEDKYGTGAQGGSFDQNQTAEQIMNHYAAMSRNDPLAFAALQKELADGGFYGPPSTTVIGGFKKQTQDALKTAMLQFLQQGSTGVAQNFTQFLASEASVNRGINGNIPGQSGSGGGSSTPLLTDPDELTRYAQMAAQNSLGRSLSKQELNSFIDQFHMQQIQSYTDAANHNGLSSMKDDPRASAIGFVTSTNKPEFEQHQIQGYTDSFLNMFLPSSTSAAPSPTMDPQGIGY
jgi:hypothetical protein